MKTRKLKSIIVYSLKYIEGDDHEEGYYFLVKEYMNLKLANYEKPKDKRYFLLTTYKSGATIIFTDKKNEVLSIHSNMPFSKKIRLSPEEMEVFYMRGDVLTIKAGEKPNKFIRDTHISLDLKKLLKKEPKNRFNKSKIRIIEQTRIFG